MVNVLGAPIQVPRVGRTVMVPVMAMAPLLVVVKALILPEPLAPRPISVLVLVQFTVALDGLGVKL